MDLQKYEIVPYGNDFIPDNIKSELDVLIKKERIDLNNIIQYSNNTLKLVIDKIFSDLHIECSIDNYKRITRIYPEIHGRFEQFYLDYESEKRVHLFNFRWQSSDLVRIDSNFSITSYMKFESSFDISKIINKSIN